MEYNMPGDDIIQDMVDEAHRRRIMHGEVVVKEHHLMRIFGKGYIFDAPFVDNKIEF